MYYLDESTGNYIPQGIKALDNMPVGAVIEYSGNDVPVGWEKVNDYSTTEQDTGKLWIDGKKIYRKVISITTYNSYFQTGITNLYEVIRLDALLLQDNNNWLSPTGTFLRLDGNMVVYTEANYQKGYVIAEYTKTS